MLPLQTMRDETDFETMFRLKSLQNSCSWELTRNIGLLELYAPDVGLCVNTRMACWCIIGEIDRITNKHLSTLENCIGRLEFFVMNVLLLWKITVARVPLFRSLMLVSDHFALRFRTSATSDS